MVNEFTYSCFLSFSRHVVEIILIKSTKRNVLHKDVQWYPLSEYDTLN